MRRFQNFRNATPTSFVVSLELTSVSYIKGVHATLFTVAGTLWTSRKSKKKLSRSFSTADSCTSHVASKTRLWSIGDNVPGRKVCLSPGTCSSLPFQNRQQQFWLSVHELEQFQHLKSHSNKTFDLSVGENKCTLSAGMNFLIFVSAYSIGIDLSAEFQNGNSFRICAYLRMWQ